LAFLGSVTANGTANADIISNVGQRYAIASAFTDGRFSAYPLPGRTYMVKAGATF